MSEKYDPAEELFRRLRLEKDEYVENLLRNSPNSSSMSELDLKRHEKMILADIDAMKREQAKKEGSLYRRFQTQFQLAAGFLVVVGGISFATNQGILSNNGEVVVSKPSSEPSTPIVEPSENTSSTKDPDSNSTSNQAGSEVFQSDDVDDNKYLSSTGMDYQSEIEQIKETIKLSDKPISLSVISQEYGKCAIELGINKQLLGIDKGKYEGESILAFFYGESKTNFNIWVVSKPCTKIIEL